MSDAVAVRDPQCKRCGCPHGGSATRPGIKCIERVSGHPCFWVTADVCSNCFDPTTDEIPDHMRRILQEHGIITDGEVS